MACRLIEVRLGKSPGAIAKRIGLNTHPLRDVDKKVTKGNLVDSFARNLTEFTMLISASGEDDRQVGILVRVGISHPASKKNGSGVQQSLFAILDLRKSRNELPEVFDLIFSNLTRLAMASGSFP